MWIVPQTLSGWLKDSSRYLNIEEPEDFKYSNGRLNNFKKRYHNILQTIAGESGSVDKVKVEEDRKLLNEKDNFSRKQNQHMKSCMYDKLT